MPDLIKIKTISDYHKLLGLPRPEHPLISLIDYCTLKKENRGMPIKMMFDFYAISIKKNFKGKLYYGQQKFDFDGGVMLFGSPKQLFSIDTSAESNEDVQGWMLLFHQDFLWNTSLAINIKKYEYFDYSVNEALFLSDKEEVIVNSIVENIRNEYHSNIDKFSKNIIITHLENLLSYSERFYNRQFITREKSNHEILVRLEKILAQYFNEGNIVQKGIPTVQFLATELYTTPNYLSGLLKSLTGLNTQQHIHSKLIEIAKEKLSTTNLSVSEIAYELGFEYSQSFNKLFKNKVGLSPLEFRTRFN